MTEQRPKDNPAAESVDVLRSLPTRLQPHLVLLQETPAITRSIADAVVIKQGDIFFLTNRDGNVPLLGPHGYGLYYHDCRYLNGYEFKIAGATYSALAAAAEQDFMTVFQFTNPNISVVGRDLIHAEQIGVEWETIIDSDNLALYDELTFHNFGFEQEIEFPVSFTYRAEFEDIFVVRGMLSGRIGERFDPIWEDHTLGLVYHGADDLYRSVAIHFAPSPLTTEETTAYFLVRLKPRETKRIRIASIIAESPEITEVGPKPYHPPSLERTKLRLQQSSEEWIRNRTQFQSDSLPLNRLMARSFRDLRMLQSKIGDHEYFTAGLPWFGALFGRDSLITAIQTLAFDQQSAANTLRLLANYQGQQLNPSRDEQPGKILHELRVGEPARMNLIPFSPYYGTVDATPLFLVLVGLHAAWSGDLTLFHELRSPIELALEWLAKYGDLNGDGFIEYQSTAARGLVNQGWKDSQNAIVNADGSLAIPPIALVEVQGYVYLAKTSLAEIYDRAGEPDRAKQLRKEAAELREKFNREFWLENQGFYALALQQNHQPCAVLSSNPGHALWSGIADPDKARLTADALMGADMFSGWGVRTLSTEELRYSPIGYHLGTVWPHDNSIIVAGFRRYGFDDEACRIFLGIVDAALDFDLYRLPEVFAGHDRQENQVPVRYPVACHPQAWAAGAVPFMLQSLLGLVPEAFDHRLRIVRPVLPELTDYVELRGLRVGSGEADLRFERTTAGVMVKVLKIQGELQIVTEPALPGQSTPSP